MKRALLFFVAVGFPLLSLPAEAQNFRCTPSSLQSAYRAIVSQCGGSFNNAYRPGARIRGSGAVSQHSYCNGINGAVDINTRNHACARNVGRQSGFYVITYGWGVHVGTDGMNRRSERSSNRRRTATGKRKNPTSNFGHWPVAWTDIK